MDPSEEAAKLALGELKAWWKAGSAEGTPEEQALVARFGALGEDASAFMTHLRREAEGAGVPTRHFIHALGDLDRGRVSLARMWGGLLAGLDDDDTETQALAVVRKCLRPGRDPAVLREVVRAAAARCGNTSTVWLTLAAELAGSPVEEMAFEEATERAPANPAPWSARGRAALRRGELVAAIAAFEKAVALGAVERDTLDALVQARARLSILDGSAPGEIKARALDTKAMLSRDGRVCCNLRFFGKDGEVLFEHNTRVFPDEIGLSRARTGLDLYRMGEAGLSSGLISEGLAYLDESLPPSRRIGAFRSLRSVQLRIGEGTSVAWSVALHPGAETISTGAQTWLGQEP